MTRLQKFIEQGAYGEKSGRVAYVFRLDLLPPAAEGMTWQEIETFDAENDLLRDAGLKEVFAVAIEKGYALVTRAS